jgi:glycosyltransferase involved in cell wall biosynthesis
MSPTSVVAKEVSVVVPVRDNQRGVDRLLRAFVDMPIGARPAEVLVVDNLSSPPVVLPEGIDSVRLLRCATPGPAAARNVGWRASHSPWILFTDADCIPTWSTISGFADALDGSVAYAGRVRAIGNGLLAEYYESQGTLLPMWREDSRPAYFVTANALVWREALEAVEGFRESFDDAGGEDVDLSIRLRAVGSLGFAGDAVVLHEFGDGFGQFVRRFARYGRGNRQVMSLHKNAGMAPRPVMPARLAPGHALCALTQFVAMSWGYLLGGAVLGTSRSAAKSLGFSRRSSS